MYTELYNVRKGWIELVCGPMFCGKTEELIRRVRRAKIAKQEVLIVKPQVDLRYHPENVVSHNENYIEALPITNAIEIFQHIKSQSVIAIDEAQFFDEAIVEVCAELADKGKRIIVAGLDKDSFGKPFGPMPFLLVEADFVTKLHAICMVCGSIASHTFRKSTSTEKILIGEKESYEPRCRQCFNSGQYNIF